MGNKFSKDACGIPADCLSFCFIGDTVSQCSPKRNESDDVLLRKRLPEI